MTLVAQTGLAVFMVSAPRAWLADLRLHPSDVVGSGSGAARALGAVSNHTVLSLSLSLSLSLCIYIYIYIHMYHDLSDPLSLLCNQMRNDNMWFRRFKC